MTDQHDDILGQLTAAGVSIWLDDISRGRLITGNLAGLARDQHVTGVTSNPTIFAHALAKSDDYQDQLRDPRPGLFLQDRDRIGAIGGRLEHRVALQGSGLARVLAGLGPLVRCRVLAVFGGPGHVNLPVRRLPVEHAGTVAGRPRGLQTAAIPLYQRRHPDRGVNVASGPFGRGSAVDTCPWCWLRVHHVGQRVNGHVNDGPQLRLARPGSAHDGEGLVHGRRV